MNIQVGFSRLAAVVGIVCGVIGLGQSVIIFNKYYDQQERSERWQKACENIAPRTWKGLNAACARINHCPSPRVGFVVRDDQTTYVWNFQDAHPDDRHMVAGVRWYDSTASSLAVWHPQHGWTERSQPPVPADGVVAAFLPLFAFAVPYGLVRALGWIISGFQHTRT